jgi:hypothetical protein
MKLIITTILAILIAYNIKAQENKAINIFNSKLEEFSEGYQTQKTLIKTDKDIYAPGEKIWFKARVLNCLTEQTGSETGILIMIKAETGEVIADSRYVAIDGNVSNHILLPSWAPEGNAFIIAHTPEALSNGEASLAAIQSITISRLKRNNYSMDLAIDKQIYEPGDKIKLKVMLKPISPAGKKEKVSAKLYNQRNEVMSVSDRINIDQLSEFEFEVPQKIEGGLYLYVKTTGNGNTSRYIHVPTTEDKLNVSFYAEGGTLLTNNTQRIVYRATDPFGNPVSISGKVYDQFNKQAGMAKTLKGGIGMISILPMPDKEYTLKLDSKYGEGQQFKLPKVHTEGSAFTLMKTEESAFRITIYNSGKYIGKELTLMAYAAGKIHFTFQFEATARNNFNISTENLPYGIINFSILTPDAEILSERLVYNKAPELPDIPIEISSKNNNVKNISVQLADFIAERGIRNADMKVVDTNSLFNNSGKLNYDFLKFPLLSSPPETVLDLFISNIELIANTYKHYSLNEILNGDSQRYQNKKNNIRGHVTDKRNRPVSNATVMLNHPNRPAMITSKTDKDGYFVFENTFAHSDMTLKAVSENGRKTYEVSLDHLFNETVEQIILQESLNRKKPYAYPDIVEYFDKNDHLLKLLGTETQDRKQKQESSTDILLKSGTSVLEVIRIMKPYNIKDNQIVFYGSTNSLNFQQGALIVIDGQKMGTSINAIENINPFDVESINISTSPVDIQQHTGLNTVGVIEIKTRGVSSSSVRSFLDEKHEEKSHSPVFNPNNFDKNVWKYQTTLIWEPNIKIDQNGEINIEVQSSDIKSNFEIILDVTSSDGIIYRKKALLKQ